MAVETITAAAGSTIADLNADWPLGPEDLRAGDDHLRNIKKALQLTFPSVSETVHSIAQELDFAHQGGTVSGNVVIKGWLTVSGTMNATNLKVSNGLSAQGNGLIATDVNASGTISASGSLVAGTTLRVNGESSFSGTVVVKQQLRVVGVATISGSAVIKDDLAIKGNLSVSGNIVGASVNGLRQWSGRLNKSGTISHYGTTASLSSSYFSSAGYLCISHNFATLHYHVILTNYYHIVYVGQSATASHKAALLQKEAGFFAFISEQSAGTRLACDITVFYEA